MPTLSINAAGLTLFVLSYFGFNFSETEIQEFITGLLNVVSFALLFWNQLKRKDTKWFFFKK